MPLLTRARDDADSYCVERSSGALSNIVKFFDSITTQSRAWIGLLCSIGLFVLGAWVPNVPAAPLFIPAALLGSFSIAYLVVHSVWPTLLNLLGTAWAQLARLYIPPTKKPPEHSRATGKELRSARLNQTSTAFFDYRFAQAFPGVRDTTWFAGKEAVKRLEVLLQSPLVFGDDSDYQIPIWWWRDGNMHISEFRRLNGRTVLIDSKELKIKYIAAVPSTDYHRRFVYILADPMKPCGAYIWDEEEIGRWVNEHGYAWEEYGLYKGRKAVTRKEYDDNATIIRGKPITLGGKVELRERYITPYNLLLAAHMSAINNTDFDSILRGYMDGILQGTKSIDDLEKAVRGLPKHIY